MSKPSLLAISLTSVIVSSLTAAGLLQYEQTDSEIAAGKDPNMSAMVMTKALMPNDQNYDQLIRNSFKVCYLMLCHPAQMVGHAVRMYQKDGMEALKTSDFYEKTRFNNRDRTIKPTYPKSWSQYKAG